MTNAEASIAIQALGKLLNVRLPVKTGLKIRSMARSINHLAEDVEAERVKLIKVFAVKDESGDPVVIDMGNGQGRYDFGEKQKEFDLAYEELMRCDVSGKPAALNVSELGDLDIEPIILLQLGELLED